MLGKPEYGWSDLKIGEFEIGVSYLTSVARDSLKAFLAYRPWNPICIHFDAESYGDVELVVTTHTAYIIGCAWMPDDSDKCGILEYNIKAEDLAKELCADISSNINEWASWDIFTDRRLRYWKEYTRNWVWIKIALYRLKRKLDKDEKDSRRRFERFQKRTQRRANKHKTN